MQSKDHWEHVYSTKAADTVSWFQPHADVSTRLIRASGLGREAAIVDVGGGASTLVDDLLDAGYENLTVLDLSLAALTEAQNRIGKRASNVRWLEGDITQIKFEPHSFDLWHDRAVFHFLTSAEERATYVQQVLHALKPGGYVMMATFGANGPMQCSGLPVVRYTPEALHSEFGAEFSMTSSEEQLHHTPFGTDQQFIYCMCRMLPA